MISGCHSYPPCEECERLGAEARKYQLERLRRVALESPRSFSKRLPREDGREKMEASCNWLMCGKCADCARWESERRKCAESSLHRNSFEATVSYHESIALWTFAAAMVGTFGFGHWIVGIGVVVAAWYVRSGWRKFMIEERAKLESCNSPTRQ